MASDLEEVPVETVDPIHPVVAPTLTLSKELSLALEALAEQTQKRVADLFRLLLSGGVTVDQFTEVAVDSIVTANVKAMSMSQFSWDTLMALLGIEIEEVPHDSRDRYMDFDRLTQAVETSLEDDETAQTRIERLAQAEPKVAGQKRYSENVAGHSKTEGWVRELDSDPCQLCVWWWREGEVWPKNHSMPTHKGCACIPKPVFVAGRISGVSKKAYEASEARKAYGDIATRRMVDPSEYTTYQTKKRK